MARPSEGFVRRQGKLWVARITATVDGRRKDIRRRAASKAEATALLHEERQKLVSGSSLSDRADRITFREVAKRFEESELVLAVYRDGRKVRGYRESNLDNQKRLLQTLRDHFGGRKLKSISPGDLESFKRTRLEAPIKRQPTKSQSEADKKVKPRFRSVATVNRELALLRVVFGWAVRHNLIEASPFAKVTKLISPADEKKRQHILTRDEEARLLRALEKETVCVGREGKHPDEPETRQRRLHIKPLIVFLLDTACRYGEAERLVWSDIEANRIVIRAENSKTLRKRYVPISGRLAKELALLRLASGGDPEATVFATGYPRTAFLAACRDSGLPSLRLHDLRHTAMTRLVESGLPLAQAMQISGHSQIQTALRYVGTTDNTLERAAAIFDGYAPSEAGVN